MFIIFFPPSFFFFVSPPVTAFSHCLLALPFFSLPPCVCLLSPVLGGCCLTFTDSVSFLNLPFTWRWTGMAGGPRVLLAMALGNEVDADDWLPCKEGRRS